MNLKQRLVAAESRGRMQYNGWKVIKGKNGRWTAVNNKWSGDPVYGPTVKDCLARIDEIEAGIESALMNEVG